jgi:uncharacterized protein
MIPMQEAAKRFLDLKRIAVTGVSRNRESAANFIFQKLRRPGREVFAVNPNAEEIEGEKCYPNLTAIGGGVEGVVIASPPASAEAIVRECAQLGVQWVWMHRSVDQGSYSDVAAALAREKGIRLIPAGCPMMYCEPVDFAHKCMRWIFGVTGRLPASVD